MKTLSRCIYDWFFPTPVRLFVVRRYQDANGSFVGELYLHETIQRKQDTLEGYVMIGASLDTLPLNANACDADTLDRFIGWTLDTRNDFLAPIMANVLRVGALEPWDNDIVRQRVARLRGRIWLTIQNRFVEAVQDAREEL